MRPLSLLRWFAFTLIPERCPSCSGHLAPVLHRTAPEIGARLGDGRDGQASDWLCCERCDYALALDLEPAS